VFGLVYKYRNVKTGERMRGREKGGGNMKINRQPLRGAIPVSAVNQLPAGEVPEHINKTYNPRSCKLSVQYICRYFSRRIWCDANVKKRVKLSS
jgi:hypothetical protein